MAWGKAVVLPRCQSFRFTAPFSSAQHSAVEDLGRRARRLGENVHDETICFRNLTLEPGHKGDPDDPGAQGRHALCAGDPRREPVRVVVHLGGHAIAALSQASTRAFGT